MLTKIYNYIKKKWIQLLIFLGIIGVAVAGTLGNGVSITAIDFNGQTISFNYGNTALRTNQRTYGGWNRASVHFALLNTKDDQNFDIRFYFEGDEVLAEVSEYLPDQPYQITVNDYGFAEYPCLTKWIATTTVDMMGENQYECEGEVRYCDRIDKEGNCEQDNAFLGTHQETRYKDVWNALPLIKTANSTSTFQSNIKAQYPIKKNEVRFFKALIKFEPKSEGEFWIICEGDKGNTIILK